MKERLDVLLVQKGYFPSRERAKTSIMAGQIYSGGRLYDKPGTKLDVDSEFEIRGYSCPFVSRGGMKLQKAVEAFRLDLREVTAMDIGASTGGFTDCMLQHGAEHVYAVDVGYGQLDWKLRNDSRVTNLEKVNVRYLDPDRIPDRMDFISIDVSFISLHLIFPVARRILKDSGEIVCLVKPQFEAGRNQVGKKGIVKDPAVHREVLLRVAGYALQEHLRPVDLTFSPMTGAKGNIEYLLRLVKEPESWPDPESTSGESGFPEWVEEVVQEAHAVLGK